MVGAYICVCYKFSVDKFKILDIKKIKNFKLPREIRKFGKKITSLCQKIWLQFDGNLFATKLHHITLRKCETLICFSLRMANGR